MLFVAVVVLVVNCCSFVCSFVRLIVCSIECLFGWLVVCCIYVKKKCVRLPLKLTPTR